MGNDLQESAIDTELAAAGTALGAGGSKRSIVAWALWDWGTQPYYTVITTFVFSVYITSAAFVPPGGDPNGPTQALALATGVGGVVIALLAPILGQVGDRTGHTVRNLRLMTWIMVVVSAGLYFVAPNPAYLWVGLGLLVVGTIAGEIGSVSYNALIDRVATRENVGKVSGFGWGLGYIGGILVLVLILALFVMPEVALFGITDADMRVRASMILCGLWTLAFTIPTFLSLRDSKLASAAAPLSLGIAGSYKALFATIAKVWKTQRHTGYFLLASALFRDGLAGVFAFGAVIAATSYGFATADIIIFGAAANLLAGLVTMAFGLVDDKLGPKFVIQFCLVLLVLSELAIFLVHQPGYALVEGMPGYDPEVAAQGHLIFWVVGLIASAAVGPAQAAARSFLARNIPEGHSGEIFGLYATTGRAISFLSPFLFFVAVSIGAVFAGNEASAQHWGGLALAALLFAGFLVMIPVKEQAKLK
ncbi:MAG: MFS transporter [Propionibacteriaceae bacterium]|jgi:UMF1 family MFS transporter|nr:MFS transporter [Propionibacteriaceae bacterium]